MLAEFVERVCTDSVFSLHNQLYDTLGETRAIFELPTGNFRSKSNRFEGWMISALGSYVSH